VTGLVLMAILIGLAKAKIKVKAVSEQKPKIKVKFLNPEKTKECSLVLLLKALEIWQMTMEKKKAV